MFDVNRFLGASITGTYEPALSAQEMVGALDDEGIEKAIIWHVAQKDLSISRGNQNVLNLVQQEKRLYGLYCLIPELCQEGQGWSEILDLMKKEQFAGVTMFPEAHRYYFSRYSFPTILEELSDRGIPLFLSMYHSGLDWKDIISCLEAFPALTCVLTDLGIYGQERKFRILLENFENIHLETSYLSLGWGVLEELVRVYGARRFLFGTGFPMRMPRAASFHLKNCTISDADKDRILSGNIMELLKWRDR